MRRVVGIDIHRTFGEVVIWENGVLRHAGRVDMTRSALEGLGNRLVATDEVVIEATGDSMASGLGGSQGGWTASCVLRPHPRQAGPPDRCRCA